MTVDLCKMIWPKTLCHSEPEAKNLAHAMPVAGISALISFSWASSPASLSERPLHTIERPNPSSPQDRQRSPPVPYSTRVCTSFLFFDIGMGSILVLQKMGHRLISLKLQHIFRHQAEHQTFVGLLNISQSDSCIENDCKRPLTREISGSVQKGLSSKAAATLASGA